MLKNSRADKKRKSPKWLFAHTNDGVFIYI